MSAQPKLNISAIIGIKDGIYQIFALIDQNLEVYSQHPGNDKLIKDCRDYIHQLDGLLEMLNLTSITLVTEKMEQAVDALIYKKIEISAPVIDALRQSTKALLFYLNELIDGAEENALRLFPAYRALMQVYGSENAPESDLFFPRLTVNPALKAQAVHSDAVSVKSLAKQLGAEYQAGLLKWLRDPSDQQGLQQMAVAVNQIETFPGTPEQRVFWWVAAGFLEDLLHLDSTHIDLTIRRLCGKIEQAIRHLAAEAPGNPAVLMRELLYHLAHSASTGQRIDEIKRSFAWPSLSATGAVTFEQSEFLNPVLERLRSTLMQTNDIWREFCAGDQESLVSLSEYIDWLLHQAQQTECAPLIKLIEAMSNTAVYLHAQPQDMNEELAMEMATALLTIESILDDFYKLPPELPHQVDVLVSRLQGVTAGDVNVNELPALPFFNALESNTQDKDLLARVAQEMLTNLGQIECILDKFFFEPSKRYELSLLSGLFKQISGALVMLQLERAQTLSKFCQNLVERLLEPDYEIIESEQILLVDGLSSLGFFIEALRSGQPDCIQIIEEALALFQMTAIQKDALPPNPENVALHATKAKPETVRNEATSTDVDSELLEIFLEEADQVLAEMICDLQRCCADPANRDALSSLRREFHTLKGSGRMVKLEEMSDVAWNLEQVLNHWLDEQRPITDQLTDLITRAHQAYAGWCRELREQGAVHVDAKTLLLAAKELLVQQTKAGTMSAGANADELAVTSEKLIALPEVSPRPPSAGSTPASDAIGQIDRELLQAFLEETYDIVPQIGSKLRAWRMLPEDDDIHHAMLRLLHTLKGSARMAGAVLLGDSIHAMESHVEAAFHERNIADSALDQLESEFDIISSQIEQLQSMSAPAVSEPVDIPSVADSSEQNHASPEKTDLLQSKAILRINSELIDRLMNDSGEASILRSGVEAQLNSFKQSLQDLAESTHRLHDQLREVEIQAETQMQSHLAQQHENQHAFDPLEFDRFSRLQELTRLMAESVDDIITVQKSLRTTHHAAEESVAQQSVINRRLQQSLLQIRTIPFSNYAERYYRIVRQVSEDMGKRVHLEILGAEVEIDRNVLEKINPPLEHLLRNAIAHGIEEPVQRQQAGKPETGKITLQLRQQGNEVIITLSDDGRGLSLPRIREEGQRLGLIQENEALDDDAITSLIFAQGLSTTDSITGISGRGIGLDVVRNEILMLSGRISVHSALHQGTSFTMSLPLTLSVAQTFMIRAGKQTYAIPAFIVEHHREFDPEELKTIYQDHCIEFNGKKYPFSHLAHLLGESGHNPEIARHNPVLFLHSGTQYLAIHTDEFLGDTEVVIKNAGSQLAHAPGIEGATITGDGEIILILNPVKLMQRSDVQKTLSTPMPELAAATQKKSVKTPTIMVVDDSLTVRKVTCRLLEREGCNVVIAKNGIEATESLREIIPDVMLIDLEMPKMNGFELIEKVRANPETAHIPMIIISSRTAEKHRKIAKGLGVDIFLGKPYKEEELLNYLSGLVKNKM
ncbi:hybrid sensor histidine kinase/response regulator [Nitrosomonas ureae]|uniref:Chemotaxis protein CheA n=1 Tax=Nitrosomonas ureae TaxID=44577 RepID=A0A1H5VF50_9PROT|nr:hybrid sensor histidine kinase/response regulator [Nitrosomonas ureae]SEF85995.1 chemosensory pili system protein ChpA (sensor histidine kinase/response regulator) [Nitrosomonas ureae]